MSQLPPFQAFITLISPIKVIGISLTDDETGHLNAAHSLKKYNRECKDTFSKRPKTMNPSDGS